ncbi:MAG TPA: heparin lyase I family protein [Polyangia bacterium]|jgi:MYXO-CTERM domain-containing protein|nr:heparin lyase I family protein [Polyangia bacterium]
MSNLAVKRTFVALSVLSAVALPAVAHATVVWTATMEKGDLSEWNGSTDPTKNLPDGTVRKNIEVVSDNVYSGTKSMKITLHPDDIFTSFSQNRVDIGHNSKLTGEGMDSYLRGYYLLVEDAKTRDEIAFYETNVTSRNWMDVWIEPKTGGGTTIKLGIESNGAILGSVLIWTGSITAGQWHQLALHVHWSNDAAKGIVDFWIDGTQVVTNYKHNTRFDSNSLFFQTGLHRVLTQPYTETLYLDDFVEGDSIDDIKLGAPMVVGDGGVVSDGGADATVDAPAGLGGATGSGGAMVSTGSGGSGSGSSGSGGISGTAGAIGSGGAMGTAGASGTSGGSGETTSSGCSFGPGQPLPLVPGNGGLVALGAIALAAVRRRRH